VISAHSHGRMEFHPTIFISCAELEIFFKHLFRKCVGIESFAFIFFFLVRSFCGQMFFFFLCLGFE
jgi:hypothetical protein